MKILYGVQGTGNGHITRARAMCREFLKHSECEVQYIFSGRVSSAYFDMHDFENYRTYKGLSFESQSGKVLYSKTVLKSRLIKFLKDISQLDLDEYDLIISDFEPISAWRSKTTKKPSLGISHQNAFAYPIPMKGENIIGRKVLNYFAPVDLHVGLHWHHFDQPILPPIIAPVDHDHIRHDLDQVLVYLPFENLADVLQFLSKFPRYHFNLYDSCQTTDTYGNCTIKPFSREGFLRDLAQSGGVLANAGFGLSSEAIQHGKKLLIKPLQGQMEQLSNAHAIELLGYGKTMNYFENGIMQEWLEMPCGDGLRYPNVSQHLVNWIIQGCETPINQLSESLWQGVEGVPIA